MGGGENFKQNYKSSISALQPGLGAIYQSSDEIVDTPILRFRRHVGWMVATAKSTGHNPIIQFQALYFFLSLSFSLYLSIFVSLSFFLSLFLSLSRSPSLSLTLSFSLSYQ